MTPGSICPSCSEPASGAFCTNCGAALQRTACTNCGTRLSSGANFCHVCGRPAGGRSAAGRSSGSPGQSPRDPIPWAVAGIALVALAALVAGQRIGSTRGGVLDAPANALAQPGMDSRTGGGQPGAARAPDISGLSPREITGRLYDLVMRLHQEGKQDSAQIVALNMAIPSFQMLDSLDSDLRYDLGRIGEVTGVHDLAQAQVDIILQDSPNHLLALALSARLAGQRGDSAEAERLYRKILAAEQVELARALPEYSAHRSELDSALARARRFGS